MKTDDLIAMLAAQATPPNPRAPARRFFTALLLGLAGSSLCMAVLLGVRPNLVEVAHNPMFWARLAFPYAIAVAALWITLRLSRPGTPIRSADWAGLALPIALAWGAGGWLLFAAPTEARLPLLLGHTWKVCPLLITLLSVPSMVAMVWAVRSMAPVRLRLAGAMTGLLAGAMAAIAYCLHCPEMAPSFWSIWYLLGMIIPGIVGAIFGPRWLRW